MQDWYITYNDYSKIFVPYRYISICEYKFHEFPEFYGFYEFYEFYELHYVDMYKVYIGNYIRNYCMCTLK